MINPLVVAVANLSNHQLAYRKSNVCLHYQFRMRLHVNADNATKKYVLTIIIVMHGMLSPKYYSRHFRPIHVTP